MLDFWKRKFNYKEPEVVKALACRGIFAGFLVMIDLYSVFLLQIGEIRSLVLATIGGLLGLIGVSIAGIAIALSMFTAKEIRTINNLKEHAFETILNTFKYFAYDVVIEIVLLIGVFFLMLSNIPAPNAVLFYVVLIAILYYFFYILFYGWALLGNYVSLSSIKNMVGKIEEKEKTQFDSFNEVAIEQLIEIIYRGYEQDPKRFYETLLHAVSLSSHPQKAELIEYIKKKYIQ